MKALNMPTCGTCGSQDISLEATVKFNPKVSDWRIHTVFKHDSAWCYACEQRTGKGACPDWAWKDVPKGNSIKVGDTIQYRGCFGMDDPKSAKVTAIDVSEFPRDKNGDSVTQVSYGIVEQDRATFSLDDNHWCYGSQVVLPGART